MRTFITSQDISIETRLYCWEVILHRSPFCKLRSIFSFHTSFSGMVWEDRQRGLWSEVQACLLWGVVKIIAPSRAFTSHTET